MPPAAFSHRSGPQRTPEGTPRVFTRCGLARGTARLGALGLAGEKLAFLSILRDVHLLFRNCGPLGFLHATIVFPQSARSHSGDGQ